MTPNFPGDLRDWFAGQALIGLMSNDTHDHCPLFGDGEPFARDAYTVADAMLAERAKRTDELPPIDTSTGGIEPDLIDWTKPIELIADGTPMVVISGPDKDGDYFVGREDEGQWSPAEDCGNSQRWYFNRCGELCGYEHLGPLIRNRREA